jgi:hypothetical protein
MTWDEWANVIASGFASLCLAALITMYALTAPWRKTSVGRQFMLTKVALMFVLVYAVCVSFVPEDNRDVFRAVRAVLILSLGGVFLRQAAIIYRVQRSGPKTNKEGNDG